MNNKGICIEQPSILIRQLYKIQRGLIFQVSLNLLEVISTMIVQLLIGHNESLDVSGINVIT